MILSLRIWVLHTWPGMAGGDTGSLVQKRPVFCVCLPGTGSPGFSLYWFLVLGWVLRWGGCSVALWFVLSKLGCAGRPHVQ